RESDTTTSSSCCNVVELASSCAKPKMDIPKHSTPKTFVFLFILMNNYSRIAWIIIRKLLSRKFNLIVLKKVGLLTCFMLFYLPGFQASGFRSHNIPKWVLYLDKSEQQNLQLRVQSKNEEQRI